MGKKLAVVEEASNKMLTSEEWEEIEGLVESVDNLLVGIFEMAERGKDAAGDTTYISDMARFDAIGELVKVARDKAQAVVYPDGNNRADKEPKVT